MRRGECKTTRRERKGKTKRKGPKARYEKEEAEEKKKKRKRGKTHGTRHSTLYRGFLEKSGAVRGGR